MLINTFWTSWHLIRLGETTAEVRSITNLNFVMSASFSLIVQFYRNFSSVDPWYSVIVHDCTVNCANYYGLIGNTVQQLDVILKT